MRVLRVGEKMKVLCVGDEGVMYIVHCFITFRVYDVGTSLVLENDII